MTYQTPGREEDTSEPPEVGLPHDCEHCGNYFDIIQHLDASNVCDFGACMLDASDPEHVETVEPTDSCICGDWEDD